MEEKNKRDKEIDEGHKEGWLALVHFPSSGSDGSNGSRSGRWTFKRLAARRKGKDNVTTDHF